MSAHPDVVDRILGRSKTKDMGTASAKSGEEPPSGIQGNGTLDAPHDQGNAPGKPRQQPLQLHAVRTEQSCVTENIAAQSDQEPRSGVQGKGTASEPYDQGNAEGICRNYV
jgi:hypothetical protein